MTYQEAYDQICEIAYNKADIELEAYTSPSDIEYWQNFEDIDVDRIINETSVFIYPEDASKFLWENDPLLKESLYLALEYGYKTKDLTVEQLASILQEQVKRNNWYKCRFEINDILSDIDEDDEDDDE